MKLKEIDGIKLPRQKLRPVELAVLLAKLPHQGIWATKLPSTVRHPHQGDPTLGGGMTRHPWSVEVLTH